MINQCHLLLKEEDEKERLSQVKELHEDDGGDNTEPLEDLFLGLSVEEVQYERHVTGYAPEREHCGRYRLTSSYIHHE